MRILYGIQFNGNGHITRSLEIIREIRNRGYKVDIIASGNKSNLSVPTKSKYRGLDLYFNKFGKINWLKTIYKSNLIRLFKDIKKINGYDLIISDFEPISAWSAKISNIKSIGIANQYSILSHPEYSLYKTFVSIFAPCNYYLPLTYGGKWRSPVRRELNINSTLNKNYYLVYLPYINLGYVTSVFSKSNLKFKIYSNNKNKFKSSKNLEILDIDSNKFINDLISCSGVITHCGFSTTSECLYLGKKLWSIPIVGQYEQMSNAKELSSLGIFTQKLNFENLNIWLSHYYPISLEYTNPIEIIVDAVEKIIKNENEG